jgi:nickel transport protein
MKRRFPIILVLFLTTLLTASVLQAHTVNYEVQQKGIAVRVFYSADDPASYSEFEVFGPGDTLPHQTGRTDKNGFVSFVPDRLGVWKVKVLGESSHGYHGVTIEVKINKDLDLESFKKPLAATYSKLITGIGLIIGIFGLYALIISRKKRPK